MIGADLHLDFQGKGFAKSMYQEFAHAILMPQGFTICTLRVLKSNERARRLYLKLGFIQTSETSEELSMEMKVEDLAYGTTAPR
jgi:ribosomal protein S18 acetylase RimI-like enzyme